MIESFRNFKVVYRNENVNNSFYQKISAENYHKHKSIFDTSKFTRKDN